VPGPACYARGGTAATVTDCNVLLGRLPDSLLGGAMALDRGAAERALRPGAAALGLDTRQFAASALELVTHNMAGAVRQVAVRRGLDAREYVLVAFGGAGPPHAARLAQLVGIRTVLVPPHPGLGSCNGLLIADILLDAVQTCVLRGAALTALAVAPVLDSLATRLRRRATDASQASVHFRADLRYVGMGSEVRVAFAAADRADAALTPLLERFHAEHRRLFGYDYRGRHAVELLALRAELRLPRSQSTGAVELLARGTPVPAPGVRECQVGVGPAVQGLRVYQRSLLPADWEEQGPLLIDQYDTTTVVGAGQRVRVDARGNLLLSIPET
jgi:N-methylhydantoinase A